MNKFLIAFLGLAVSGCISLPVLRHAQPDRPSSWPAATAPGERVPGLVRWWTLYDDPNLVKLVDEALVHNGDLLAAAARIEEARAALNQSDADLQPYAQIGANTGRSRITGVGSPAMPTGNDFKLNAQASYELDLWGRYRQASAAARADLLASEYAREVVRTSLAGTVALGYFQIAALDASLQLTQETLANRKVAVELYRARFNAGLDSELPWRQAEAELAAVESTQADLERQVRQQENALALLLGRAPRAGMQDRLAHGKGLDVLTLPPAIPDGLPAEMLTRRPDIRQAGQRLAGAEARVMETRAAIYPTLSLTANLGSESRALANLFSGPAAIWGLGTSLVQTVYNAGRTEAALKGDATRQEQALLAYEQTLRIAFKEVLDALVAVRQTRVAEAAEVRRAEALTRAVELADLRYRSGVSNYLEVLDAQRMLYQSEQNRIEDRRARLAAAASLFKALGGGWLPRPETSPPGGHGST